MNIQHIVDLYHTAADEFSRGNPLPVKMMFSHQDDVSLANPFGPPVSGWSRVSEALDFASSRFKDGKVINFETIAKYETSELVTILEIEKWKAKVSGREDVSFSICVLPAPFETKMVTGNSYTAMQIQ